MKVTKYLFKITDNVKQQFFIGLYRIILLCGKTYEA